MKQIIKNLKKAEFKKKVIVIPAIIFLLIISVSVILNVSFSANEVNSFHGIELKSVDVGNITISNMTIDEENGITKYEANIKANEEGLVNYVKIIFKDEQKNEIVSLIGYVGSNLNKGEIKKIEASTDADVTNAKSINYEVVR